MSNKTSKLIGTLTPELTKAAADIKQQQRINADAYEAALRLHRKEELALAKRMQKLWKKIYELIPSANPQMPHWLCSATSNVYEGTPKLAEMMFEDQLNLWETPMDEGQPGNPNEDVGSTPIPGAVPPGLEELLSATKDMTSQRDKNDFAEPADAEGRARLDEFLRRLGGAGGPGGKPN